MDPSSLALTKGSAPISVGGDCAVSFDGHMAIVSALGGTNESQIMVLDQNLNVVCQTAPEEAPYLYVTSAGGLFYAYGDHGRATGSQGYMKIVDSQCNVRNTLSFNDYAMGSPTITPDGLYVVVPLRTSTPFIPAGATQVSNTVSSVGGLIRYSGDETAMFYSLGDNGVSSYRLDNNTSPTGGVNPDGSSGNFDFQVIRQDYNDLLAVYQSTGNLLLWSVPRIAPVMSAVIDSGDFTPGVAPGGYMTVYGINLGAFPGSPTGQPANAPFPTEWNHGRLKVQWGNSTEYYPIAYSSPNQVNCIFPPDVPPGAQTIVTYETETSPGTWTDSQWTEVQVPSAKPHVFAILDLFLPLNQNNIVYPFFGQGVNPGDILAFFTGSLGPTVTPIPTGQPAPMILIKNPPTVTIGGVPVTEIDYAGTSPGLMGLWQMNLRVPAGVAPGMQQVVLTASGATETASVLINGGGQ